MKLVIDTNVLIAAFVTHGVCNELLEYCAINHEIILSSFILDELRDNLVRKFEFSSREAGAVIRLLKSRAVLVTPRVLEKPTCRDPDDDPILGTALAGGCECIVTGDKDLLDLQCVQGIRMIKPSAFWAAEK
jgi:uncharacterized protein